MQETFKTYKQGLSADFNWEIPNFLEFLEPDIPNKIVSNPFGPVECRFQAVIFPRGVPDSGNENVGVFVRPIKNVKESLDTNWKRDVLWLLFRVKVEDREDSEIVREEYYPRADCENGAFEGKGLGIGTDDFIQKQDIENCLQTDGSLLIEISVGVEETVKSLHVDYQTDFAIGQHFFGNKQQNPKMWNIEITKSSDEYSISLIAVKTKLEELMDDFWCRALTSMRFILRSSKEEDKILVMKTITGGNVYHEGSQKYDVPNFVTLTDVKDIRTMGLKLDVSFIVDSATTTTNHTKQQEAIQQLTNELRNELNLIKIRYMHNSELGKIGSSTQDHSTKLTNKLMLTDSKIELLDSSTGSSSASGTSLTDLFQHSDFLFNNTNNSKPDATISSSQENHFLRSQVECYKQELDILRKRENEIKELLNPLKENKETFKKRRQLVQYNPKQSLTNTSVINKDKSDLIKMRMRKIEFLIGLAVCLTGIGISIYIYI